MQYWESNAQCSDNGDRSSLYCNLCVKDTGGNPHQGHCAGESIGDKTKDELVKYKGDNSLVGRWYLSVCAGGRTGPENADNPGQNTPNGVLGGGRRRKKRQTCQQCENHLLAAPACNTCINGKDQALQCTTNLDPPKIGDVDRPCKCDAGSQRCGSIFKTC